MSGKSAQRGQRYARLMGDFWRHPRTSALSTAAAGVLARAFSYCADQMTDGAIPAALVPAFFGGAPDEAVIEEMIAAGVWKKTKTGFQIRDWGQRNITREAWAEKKAQATTRQQKSRANRAQKKPKVTGDERSGHASVTRDTGVTTAPVTPPPLDDDDDDDENPLKSGASGARAEAGPLATREVLLARLLTALHRGWDARHLERLAAPAPPAHFEALRPLATWCAEYLETHDADDPDELVRRLLTAFWGRTDLRRPTPRWLAEDPLRYVTGADAREAPKPRRITDRLPPGSGIGFSEDDIAPAAPAQREVSYG